MSAEAAILQVLLAGPGHGLELIRRVKERTRGRLVLGHGSVYPKLRELEGQGLVEAHAPPA